MLCYPGTREFYQMDRNDPRVQVQIRERQIREKDVIYQSGEVRIAAVKRHLVKVREHMRMIDVLMDMLTLDKKQELTRPSQMISVVSKGSKKKAPAGRPPAKRDGVVCSRCNTRGHSVESCIRKSCSCGVWHNRYLPVKKGCVRGETGLHHMARKQPEKHISVAQPGGAHPSPREEVDDYEPEADWEEVGNESS